MSNGNIVIYSIYDKSINCIPSAAAMHVVTASFMAVVHSSDKFSVKNADRAASSICPPAYYNNILMYSNSN
jgi:hypothetical protein